MYYSLINSMSKGGVAFDIDAQAFITAASITDATQKSAINTLVTSLKNNNIWSKMLGIYPFVGGTASQHRFNLKDPRALDAAFRLQFWNGWTHSSTGAKPNGTDGYADTWFNPSTSLTSILSCHASFYSRTQIRGGIDIGLSISGAEISVAADCNISGIYGLSNIGSQYAGNLSSNTSTGFFLGNRQTATNNKILQNNTTLASNTTSSSSTKPNGKVYLGGQNANSTLLFPAAREMGFASIGNGLTDTEAGNLYSAVVAFNTTLGRNI